MKEIGDALIDGKIDAEKIYEFRDELAAKQNITLKTKKTKASAANGTVSGTAQSQCGKSHLRQRPAAASTETPAPTAEPAQPAKDPARPAKSAKSASVLRRPASAKAATAPAKKRRVGAGKNDKERKAASGDAGTDESDDGDGDDGDGDDIDSLSLSDLPDSSLWEDAIAHLA